MFDIISVLDADGRVSYTSPSVERQLGYTPGQWLGSATFDLVHPEDRGRLRAWFAKTLSLDGVSDHIDYRFKHAGGSWRVLESVAVNLIDVPAVSGVVITSRDVTDQKHAEEVLAHQALHDALTGLPNRTLLNDRLQQGILAAQRQGGSVGLLLMNLNGLREINEAFGHDLGDDLLRQIGPRIRAVLRGTDTIARIGGDEFAIALHLTGDVSDAELMATKMGQALEAPFTVQGNLIEVGASIGVAVYPAHAADALALLRRADTAMYEAKRLREGYVVYASEHDHDTASRLTLTRELRQGIGEDQLQLYYQPQVDLRTRRVVAMEALVRWSHPRHGLMEPKLFVPVAEQTGLIKPLSYWVLAAAIGQCQRWLDAGLMAPVSVNLSMRNLRDPALVDTVADLLASTALDPAYLTIEITETAIMTDSARTLAILSRLTDMGLTLCVDDFGTGYSSLTYLKRLPLSEVKVDQSFVGDMVNSPSDTVIVRSTIELAHALGLKVVAEGVENEAQVDLLRRLGCDAAQGLYLGAPAAPADLDGLFRRVAAAVR